MPGSLQILVYERQQEVCQDRFTGAVALGRQRDAREAAYSSHSDGRRARLVIARANEDTVSREHVLIEPLDGGRVRLTNSSAKVSIGLADGKELKAGQSCEQLLPAVIVVGEKTIKIQDGDTRPNGRPPLHGLAEATLPPGSMSMSARFSAQALQGILHKPAQPNIQMEEVVRWLQATMEVLQSAAGSPDFAQKAAQAVVEIVGLDRGQILLYNGSEWEAPSSWSSQQGRNDTDWRPSRTILARLLREKRTLWQDPGTKEQDVKGSLIGVEVVVASPILSPQGEVLGAIYGDCCQDSLAAPRVTRLEAVLVELLAGGVAAGLARMEQERAAMSARVQFEQFFTPQLAQQLARERNLLDGRDAEVTVLFCDIRSFSRISERLGPEGTVHWVSHVMEALSECVLRHSGVLVDYIGDEMMAMWGAPVAQPNHARLACSAALDMLGILPALNERWEPVLQERFTVGFGLNTGVARVGNTGSRHKFKYGPLGATVNLASRVQSATKRLRCPLVVTEHTHKGLDGAFPTRKLCRVGSAVDQSVDLYELMSEGHSQAQNLKFRYETALQQFTESRFREAMGTLGNLLADAQEDGPALVLLSHAVNALVHGPARNHPVWDLFGR